METSIVEKLNEVMSQKDVQEIIAARDDVLGRFSPLFKPNRIITLEEKDFRQFLNIDYNKHWSGLHRMSNRLCNDMKELRETLGVLVDENQPIDARADHALGLFGLGHGILTAILHVAYPNKYGVWNNTSEKALVTLGLWPSFERGMSKGQKYVLVNSVLQDIAEKMGIDLWTLDSLWFGLNPDIETSETQTSGKPNRNDSGSSLSDRAKSVYEITQSVLDTVKNSNGQKVETIRKNKELLMPKLELEKRVMALLESQDDRCAITGLPFQFVGAGDELHMRPSLDRIDSEGHYEASNIQLVCRFINFWKSNTPDDEFRHLIEVVRKGEAADPS